MGAAAPDPGDATREALLAQFAVKQFLLDLELVDVFLFDVLVVPTARIARILFALVGEVLGARRGQSIHARVLGPDPSDASALDPVAEDMLIDRVLRPLLLPPEPVSVGVTLTWIDASTARIMDRDAWAALFARLNERRNAVIEAQRGPLVMVVPPWLEGTLAHAAPDTWSIRSGVYRVRHVDVETGAWEVDARRSAPVSHSAVHDRARYLPVTLSMESELPIHLFDAARAWTLAETVPRLLHQGSVDEAMTVASQAVQFARASLAEHPESSAAKLLLAGVLNRDAEVAAVLGESPKLRELEEERLALIENASGSAPATYALLTSRADARRYVAILRDDDSRIRLAREAIEDARRAVDLEPKSPTATVLLANCLLTLAQVEDSSGAMDDAIGHVSEAIELAEGVRRLFDRPEAVDENVSPAALAVRSRIYLKKGRHGEAIRDAQSAVERARGLARKAANNPDAALLALACLDDLANCYNATGDFEREADAAVIFREEAGRASRLWPQSLEAVRYEIKALERSAVLSKSGNPDASRVWIAEGISLASAVARRSSDQRDHESLVVLERLRDAP